jgi:type I restriction enzyme M protein
MHEHIQSAADEDTLQKRTFYGKELKGLAYIIAMMNLILHGVESPNIIKTNTLTENLANVQTSNQMNVVLANPPFGGSERDEVQQNFPIRSGETAYMFLQHFIKMLRAGGRAGIVIKNTFLSNSDNASVALRQKLLEECRVDAILDLPSGVFTGAGVKTVVLFFTKGEPTENVWYYQLEKHFTKTKPLTEKDLEEFLTLSETRADSDHSWTLRVADLDANLDMSVKNPHKVEEVDERTPAEIIYNIQDLMIEADDIFQNVSYDLFPPDYNQYPLFGEFKEFEG